MPWQLWCQTMILMLWAALLIKFIMEGPRDRKGDKDDAR